MNPQNRMQLPRRSKKLMRLIKHAKKKMGAYRDEMNSPNGQVARAYLSGIAVIVAEGNESPKFFKHAIVLAAETAGVPVSVMSSLGAVILVWFTDMVQQHDRLSVAGGRKNA